MGNEGRWETIGYPTRNMGRQEDSIAVREFRLDAVETWRG